MTHDVYVAGVSYDGTKRLTAAGDTSATCTTTSGALLTAMTYTYAGRGGRVSDKATAVTLTGAPTGNFSQSFTRTELAQLYTLAYPTDDYQVSQKWHCVTESTGDQTLDPML
ncbi:MAG: hypothetical protein GX464_06030 [Holophagae bacterium]|nr:hypothetical protein [Holophagae bacterium]